MNVTDAILKRKSIRAFKDTPVGVDTVKEILEKATRAASGGNTQPWHFYVVTGGVLEELTNRVKTELENGNLSEKAEYQMYPPTKASAEYMKRRRKIAYDMYQLLGIDRSDQMGRLMHLQKNFAFFGAPVAIFVTLDRIVDRNGWGHAGMALQNIALLAEEQGLQTCFQEAWANFPSVVYETLGVPGDEILWCAVALGQEDKSAKVNSLVTEREPLHSLTRFYGFNDDNLSKL